MTIGTWARTLCAAGVACSLFATGCTGAARTAHPPVAAPVPAPAAPVMPPPLEPARRADLAALPLEGAALGLNEWQARHRALLEAPGRSAAELVVVGDGMAEAWCGSRAFQKQWRKRKPLNLALPGEQTQQLLWRIEHGLLAGLSPRLVMLAIGSENLAQGFSPEETAQGIGAVLSQIRAQLPASQVLLLALLPAGQAASDPRRAPIQATNQRLLALAAPGAVLVTDPGGVFLEADGSLADNVMSDAVQPTPLGYEALTLSVSLVAQKLLEGGLR